MKGTAGISPWFPAAAWTIGSNRKVTIRLIDYEYQIWPTALGDGLPSNGLTPHGFSFGAGYRIF